tara:strand:- start:676 stop:2400 length:1725 start_codon:yes stop_codon:yes gene_type:complete
MISKVYKILEKKDFIKLQVIFLLNFFTFFFELLSLGLIPIFVSFIFEIQTVLDKFEKYGVFFFSNIDNDSLVKYLGIFIILVFIVKNIFYFFFVYIQGKFVADIKEKVSKKLLNFYVTCPFPFHLNNNPAQLTRNTTNSIDGLSIYILRLVELLKESLAILVIFILLSFVNFPITLIIFLIFSFFGFLYLNTIRPSYKKKAKANENYKINLIQTINETFGAIKDIKLHNKESEIISNYNRFRHNYEKNLFHFSIIQKIPRLLLETMAIFIITISALIFFNSGYDLLAFLTILSLIVVAIVRFIPAFNSIISSIFYIRMFEPSVEIIFNEFKKINNLKTRQAYKIQTSHEKILESETSFITLKNISFSYDNEANTTLKNVNIDIEKGTIVGVTGETGAGKSTLFHIILGLLEPKSGVVLFKNQNINLDIVNWRNQIGYIAQNIYLLDDTIEKNISFDFLEKEIDKERMNFAIKMSCLQKKIFKLPDGLRTKVGNDGLRLSGGEKQRIALARAIYKNPDIFFMDESTSALDSETEQKIMLNLKNNFSKKTIILIAHRKSTIDACDKIINIKNGVII